MIRSNVALAALAWLLAAPTAFAATMCDGPCSVTMEFPSGGSITAADGATFTFGPEGGLFVLGEGGSMTLGEGGSVTTLEGGPTNMSQGGSIVLGPGGSIDFGTDGSLATGNYGNIAADGALTVASARNVAISSDQAVHLGDLESWGRVELTTDGDVNGCDTSTPLHFSMITDDTETNLTVAAGEGMSLGTLKGDPDLYVTTTSYDSSITLCAEGTFNAGEGSGGGSGGDPGSGLIVWTNTGGGTFNNPTSATRGLARTASSGGATDPLALLLFALLRVGRRRR